MENAVFVSCETCIYRGPMFPICGSARLTEYARVLVPGGDPGTNPLSTLNGVRSLIGYERREYSGSTGLTGCLLKAGLGLTQSTLKQYGFELCYM